MKRELQEWVDREYNAWIADYSPKRHEGDGALENAMKVGEEFTWTCSDQFLQDYVTLSDGTELSYRSVDILPGIQDESEDDLFFTSSKSWQEADVDMIRVAIEVVVTCTNCAGNGCTDCENSGEWSFVASKWNVEQSEKIMSSKIELFDIPISSIFVNDSDPDLLLALEPYDAQLWDRAKCLLEPLALAGNRLALFKYANTLDNLGHIDAAEQYWKLAKAAGDIKAGINLANLFKDQGRNHDQIIQLYRQAIEGGNVDAIRNLALYIEDDEPEEAEALYLQAVEAGDAKSCANLALQYFNEGNDAEALKYAELGFQRGNIHSVTLLAMQHVNREEWEPALEQARRALTLASPENAPYQAQPYKFIVLSLIHLLRFDEADQAIQDCRDHGITDLDELEDLLEMYRQYRQEVVPDEADFSPKFCTNCGTKAQAGNLFCSNCGSRF